MFRRSLLILLLSLLSASAATDTFTPYTAGTVPQTAKALWQEFDARKESLDVEVVKEWEQDNTVCRIIRFTVGTFKGTPARLAAFYTFPKGKTNLPAFVWSHGGGQRADVTRGLYFASQGYAVIDINWNGRSMQDGVEINTDWGKIDPSQGPKFYPGALRKHYKADLMPDEFTVDTIPSPRNSNWYLLGLAGRRAITFLEQQPEVDKNRLGFTGFSMGGMITSIASTDQRLKAAAPMVGGSGYRDEDFVGIPGTGRPGCRNHQELFNNTIDARSYWPDVKIPVLFVSSSNDFHAPFERVYKAMGLLPHSNWRFTHNIHGNHGPGREQWMALTLWFNQYLKMDGSTLPQTAKSKLNVSGDTASFTVNPDKADKIRTVEIYYSHDANSRSRFWYSAKATRNGNAWTATLPVRPHLPLFAFANCTYPSGKARATLYGDVDAFSLSSQNAAYVPKDLKPERLTQGAKFEAVLSDLSTDLQDWGNQRNSGLVSYKLRDPQIDFNHAKKLVVELETDRPNQSLRVRVSKNKYITGVKAPQASFGVAHQIKEAGKHRIVFTPEQFTEKGKTTLTDWSNVATISVSIYSGADKANLDLHGKNRGIIKRLIWE